VSSRLTSQGSIAIQIIGDDRGVAAMLSHLDTALNPAGVASFLGATVDPWLRSRARDRFMEEGDDVTGKWVPLASATQQIRSTQGYGSAHPINRRTGRLEEYVAGSPNAITIHSLGATLTFPGRKPTGELKKKLETAQSGRVNPNTPPRPVLGMNEADMAFVLTALALYIKGGQLP
jgi:hypothetical protein